MDSPNTDKYKNSKRPRLEQNALKQKNSKIDDFVILNKDGTFTCKTCGEILDNLNIANAHQGECIDATNENATISEQISNVSELNEGVSILLLLSNITWAQNHIASNL